MGGGSGGTVDRRHWPRRHGVRAWASAGLGHALLEQGAKAALMDMIVFLTTRVTGQVRRGLGAIGLVQGQADAALLPVDGEVQPEVRPLA